MNSNLLPGMVDDNVEMFVTNSELKVIQNGEVIPFEKLAFPTITLINEEIEKNELIKSALF